MTNRECAQSLVEGYLGLSGFIDESPTDADAVRAGLIDGIEHLINDVILAEREECVKVAEDGQTRTCGDFFVRDRGHECGRPNWDMPTVDQIALAIRARSNPEQGSEADIKEEKLYTYTMDASVFNQPPDRIRQLHETIGEQAEKIRSLERQLEEKRVSNEQIAAAVDHARARCGKPDCVICQELGAVNRKA